MYCTSEPCEHMFGNICQSDREFTCSDFSNHVDKQNRRFELTYKSDLRMSKEDNLSGYQSTFSDFIVATKNQDLCSGPCRIDSTKDASVSLQLWPYVKHCLHTCTDKMKPLFNLLGVKIEDRCVFYNKADSITTLLKQLISTAPRSFTYNNISGSESEHAIMIDDKADNNKAPSINHDDIVAQKMQQFANDMNSKDDDDIDMDSDSEAKLINTITKDDDIKELDKGAEENKNDLNNREQKRKKKYEEIDRKNKMIMNNTIALVQCNNISELSELALSAISNLDDTERGSLSDNKKVKSFLGRWYQKTKISKIEDKCLCKDDTLDKECLFIERDRIITSNITIRLSNENNNETTKKTIEMKYRVLSVCTKRYNRWFMTSEKQKWNPFMKEEDLKKFRCAIRMIVDGAFEGYDDMPLISEEWPRNHICKVITGVEIVNVLNEMHNY